MKNKKITILVALIFVLSLIYYIGGRTNVLRDFSRTLQKATTIENNISNSQNSSKPNPNLSTKIQEKVFLYGGKQNNGISQNRLNDVWLTENMISWQEFLPNGQQQTPWSGRSGFGAVYFNNKIWIVGGETNSGNMTNQVYSSENGLVWNLTTAQAPWSPRLATNALVVFDDGTGARMWLVGGYNNSGLPNNQVWTSADGANWTLKNTIPWNTFSGAKYSVEIFNGKIFVFGADTNNKVWIYDPANSSWSGQGNFPKYKGFALKKYGGNLYSFGGDLASVATSDFKISSSGLAFTTQSPAPISPRNGHKSVVFAGKIWFLGGYGNGVSHNDVWSYNPFSSIWLQANVSGQNSPFAPWLARSDFGLVVVPASFGTYP